MRITGNLKFTTALMQRRRREQPADLTLRPVAVRRAVKEVAPPARPGRLALRGVLFGSRGSKFGCGPPCPDLASDKARSRRTGRVANCGVDGSLATSADFAASRSGATMILSAIAAKLKRRSKDDCKGRHFEGIHAVRAAL